MPEHDMGQMRKDGGALFRSAQNLWRSTANLSALTRTIYDRIKELQIKDGKVAVEKINYKDVDEYSNWCRIAQVVQAVVTANEHGGRGRPRTLGSMTVAIRLCDFETVEDTSNRRPWDGQAVCLVGWHRRVRGREASEWQAWSLDAGTSETRDLGNGLWRWDPEADNDWPGYFYVLPLFALENEQCINDYILKPLQTLFPAAKPAKEAKTALRGVPVLQPPPA